MGNEKSDSGELPKKKAEGEGPWYGHLAQPLAILFWLYAITQIFVFDVDAALQSRLP